MELQPNKVILIVRDIVLKSKWVLVPFYFGLIVAQCFYCVKFVIALYEMTAHFMIFNENEMMLAVLGLIDITMIANLVKTIIGGSYYSFVEKIQSSSENISSGYLKVKIGMSLIGISSIHLLQAFINSSEMTNREIIVKCSIHVIFLVSTIGLAFIEFMHEKSKMIVKEAIK
jgi:uncharacterized protein (TIGR00645 family)